MTFLVGSVTTESTRGRTRWKPGFRVEPSTLPKRLTTPTVPASTILIVEDTRITIMKSRSNRFRSFGESAKL